MLNFRHFVYEFSFLLPFLFLIFSILVSAQLSAVNIFFGKCIDANLIPVSHSKNLLKSYSLVGGRTIITALASGYAIDLYQRNHNIFELKNLFYFLSLTTL